MFRFVSTSLACKRNSFAFIWLEILILSEILLWQPLSNQYKNSASLEDLLVQTSLLPSAQNSERVRTPLSKTPSKSSCQEISLDIEENRSRHNEDAYQPLKDDSVNATPSTESDSLPTRQFKKRVNIQTNDLKPSKENLCSSSISFENGRSTDSRATSPLNMASPSERSQSTADNYLTLTGTIKRGRKKGQAVDLQLNMSREELEKINAAALLIQQAHDMSVEQHSGCCGCSLTSGMHILMLSLISFPFVLVVSSIYAFYIGTLTWYNMFTYFSEEKSCLYKFLMCPLLILAYPFGIVLCTVGLGVYSACVQISTKFAKWMNEIADIEKGFYGWLCSFLHLSDCSPYETVILTDLKMPPEPVQATSTEELSL